MWACMGGCNLGGYRLKEAKSLESLSLSGWQGALLPASRAPPLIKNYKTPYSKNQKLSYRIKPVIGTLQGRPNLLQGVSLCDAVEGRYPKVA